MRTVFAKYFFVFFLTCFAFVKTSAQDETAGFKINMELTADEKGIVAVNLKTKYNALYWDRFRQKEGRNKSIIKNNYIKSFVKYQLSDFDIINNDMEQTSYVKFNILGLLKLDEGGKWIAELDTKDPDITKISETQFVMVDEDLAQSYKINLPASAKNSKIEKDHFGKAILTYTATVIRSDSATILKYTGFLIAAAGIFLFFKYRFSKN